MATFYEELEHTADWTVRVWGDSLPELFQRAAAAMFELQGADLDAETSIDLEIGCQALDNEALLVAWLNELLYASETRDILFTRFEVTIYPLAPLPGAVEELALTARAQGFPGRGPMAHIKAVTYYELAVLQSAAGWEATITFDT